MNHKVSNKPESVLYSRRKNSSIKLEVKLVVSLGGVGNERGPTGRFPSIGVLFVYLSTSYICMSGL